MKKNKLLLILAIVAIALTMVLAACGDCEHKSYGEWKIAKAPTSDATGEAIRLCVDCGVAEVAPIAKLTDTSVWTLSSTDATHETAGKITYTSAYGKVEVSVDRLAEHVYDKEVASAIYLVSAADCVHAATYRKSCVCGAVGTETFTSGAALGHDGKSVPVVTAVHTTTSLVNAVAAHYECDRCGKLFTDAACSHETTLAALTTVTAHTYGAWTIVSEPTCTTAGSVSHVCTVCQRTESSAIAAHDHDYSSGKIVVVTSQDIYQEDDGTIVEGDEEATQYHARVCDICHVVDKTNKEGHEYGDEYLIISYEEHSNLHEVLRRHKCEVCGYVEATGSSGISGVQDSLGYLEYAWTAGETVAATYTSDGYTVYTQGSYEVKLALPKLVAPYDNKTYTALELSQKDNVNTGTVSTYSWPTQIALDDKGAAIGSGAPFNGEVLITIVNSETGEITLVVGNETYEGYVESSTGIMVISEDNYNTVLIVSPYEVSSKVLAASYWNDTYVIDYHIDCGTYLGHDIGILVNNGVVYFGVTFVNEQDVPVVAEEGYLADVLVVKAANGGEIATFVKNSDGVLEVSDELRGEYKATMDIDSETDVEVGNFIIDGIGKFVFKVEDQDDVTGTYQAIMNGDELVRLDAYVIVNGKKAEYYHITVDAAAKTVKLVPQTITITLSVGEHGTVEETTITAFVGCAVNLPKPSAEGNYVFLRWMNGNTAVTEATTFEQDVTITAKWAAPVTINVVDAFGGDTSVIISVETPIVGALPKQHVVGKTINSANNTVFDGWYLDEDFTRSVNDEMVPGDDGESITVYAKWVELGIWTVDTNRTDTFRYDESDGVWKNTNKGKNSSTSTMEIIANGKIVVSFDYWVSSESLSYDYLDVWYYNDAGTRVSDRIGGQTMTAATAKHITTVVNDGDRITFSYRKDGSGDGGSQDTAYIVNLTINGRAIIAAGTPDFLDGTYTSNGKDNLVLNGYGSFTWGTKTGTYAKAEDSGVIDMYVVEDSKNVEYYELTLDGTTYTATKSMVTITFSVPTGCDEVTAIQANKNITVSTLPQSTSTAGDGKTFIGWYSKDGTDDDWGELVTAPVTFTKDTTLYARWVAPHALFGEYKGYAFGSSATTTVTTLTINELGVVTSTTMRNAAVESYDPSTGAVWFVNGSNRYYGVYNADDQTFVINNSASADATIGSTPYVLFKCVEVANQKYLVSKNAYKVVAMEVSSTDRLFLLDDAALHTDVSVVVNKADGTSVSDIATLRTLNSSTNGFVYVVTKDSTHLVSISYLSGMGLDICDGTEGMYTNGDDKVWVLGIGAIMMDGKLGKLVAVDGQDNTYIANVGTTSSATPVKESYVIVLDAENKTYTIADNKVTVSFNFAGLSGSLDALQIYAGVETNLPAAGPAITGYTFRGWYNNAELTGSAVTKVTPTADTVIYAKYDKAITVTIVYGNDMTNGSVTDKFANDKVTVALPDTANGLYAEGWYTTANFEAGSEWTSGSIVTDDLTIYCKWVEPHALMGTYNGVEFDSTALRGTNTATITISPTGVVSGKISGALTPVDEENGVYSVAGCYLHIDTVSKTAVINYSTDPTTALKTELYVLVNAGETTTITSAYHNQNTEWYIVWDKDYTKLGKITVNGADKFYFVYQNKVYGDVTVAVNGANITNLSAVKTANNILAITHNGVEVFKGKYDGTTFVGQDGKQGTYTGTIGTASSITLDGYGLVIIGDDTVMYALNENKITFALNNRMMVVELGDGNCAQVQDGIAGTYTLPDDAGTIVLDGLGGAGGGKTYVVEGNNITIYDGESSTAYGLDVDNKVLLGKSIFAGLIFRNGTSTVHYVEFDDSSDISGTFYMGNSGWYVKFTGELSGTTLTLTVTSQSGTGASTSATITITVSENTLTVTSPSGFSYASFASNKTYTCADFHI